VDRVHGVARVALRLGGGVPEDLHRGSVLVAPQAWRYTDVVDVRLSHTGDDLPPERPVLHIGATAVGCHCRPLGRGHARLTLERPLPLRVADRALLRDTGTARIWGVLVLDPAPPSVRRRGAARRRGERLASITKLPDLDDDLQRRGVVQTSLLRRIGVPLEGVETAAVHADGWLLDRRRVTDLSQRLADLVREHAREHPLSAGLPMRAAAQALDLPADGLVRSLLAEGMHIRDGRIQSRGLQQLPPEVEGALARLEEELGNQPFRAPDAARLTALGLHRQALAAAEKAGRLLRLSESVVLLPGSDDRAVEALAALPQPFTASQARVHLDTTRRVVLPLLDLLDRRGLTTRLPDDRRRVSSVRP
jgi:selenocysteine-specific elongation factor